MLAHQVVRGSFNKLKIGVKNCCGMENPEFARKPPCGTIAGESGVFLSVPMMFPCGLPPRVAFNKVNLIFNK
jgi:hypothetical protein